MCGRYLFNDGQHPEVQALIQQLKLEFSEDFLKEVSLNEVFPTQKTIVCTTNLKPHIMRWGYAKWNQKGHIINARSESLESSNFFKQAGKKRCIIMASGYFEWDEHKVKTYFHHPDPLYMAAIYNTQEEFAILTQQAKMPYAQVHHRMPVLFNKENALHYLNHEEVRMEIPDLSMTSAIQQAKLF